MALTDWLWGVQELKEAAKKLMIDFLARTRHKPKRIIMYR